MAAAGQPPTWPVIQGHSGNKFCASTALSRVRQRPRSRLAGSYPLLRERVVLLMRRRLHKLLPIVLIALVVQILAPIAACWAASIAASAPLGSALGSASLCRDNAAARPA